MKKKAEISNALIMLILIFILVAFLLFIFFNQADTFLNLLKGK